MHSSLPPVRMYGPRIWLMKLPSLVTRTQKQVNDCTSKVTSLSQIVESMSKTLQVVLMKLGNKTTADLYKTGAQIGRLEINTSNTYWWRISRFHKVCKSARRIPRGYPKKNPFAYDQDHAHAFGGNFENSESLSNSSICSARTTLIQYQPLRLMTSFTFKVLESNSKEVWWMI